jgi:hypothetical protein
MRLERDASLEGHDRFVVGESGSGSGSGSVDESEIIGVRESNIMSRSESVSQRSRVSGSISSSEGLSMNRSVSSRGGGLSKYICTSS